MCCKEQQLLKCHTVSSSALWDVYDLCETVSRTPWNSRNILRDRLRPELILSGYLGLLTTVALLCVSACKLYESALAFCPFFKYWIHALSIKCL